MRDAALDTSPEMERLQAESLRRLTERERLNMACQLSTHVWRLARRAFDERFPQEDPMERDHRFLAVQYGEDLATAWRTTFASRGGR